MAQTSRQHGQITPRTPAESRAIRQRGKRDFKEALSQSEAKGKAPEIINITEGKGTVPKVISITEEESMIMSNTPNTQHHHEKNDTLLFSPSERGKRRT